MERVSAIDLFITPSLDVPFFSASVIPRDPDNTSFSSDPRKTKEVWFTQPAAPSPSYVVDGEPQRASVLPTLLLYSGQPNLRYSSLFNKKSTPIQATALHLSSSRYSRQRLFLSNTSPGAPPIGSKACFQRVSKARTSSHTRSHQKISIPQPRKPNDKILGLFRQLNRLIEL